jgi:arylsulfatase
MRLRGEHTLEFELKSDGHSIDTLAFNNFSGIRRSGTGTLTHYRSLEKST